MTNGNSMTDKLKSVAAPAFSGKIGIARADITPPVGIYCRNWGAAAHDRAEGIHRSLNLHVIVITAEDDQTPLVLVDADLGWWRSLDTFHNFQHRVLSELNLEAKNFIFALSHTHAAPPLTEAESDLPGSELIGPWMEKIFQSTVDSVRKAQAEMFEATIEWQTSRCDLAAVRDLPDPQGNRVVCGYDPTQVADDTMLVGRVTDQTGNIRATMVNYACHPTVLAWDNTSISPDYIGAMRTTIESSTDAIAFFLQGASGDVAPRYQYVGDPAVADRHGRQLGFAALATLESMEPPKTQLVYSETVESGAPLAVWKHRSCECSPLIRMIQRTVELPIKDWPSAEELEQQRLACEDRALEERLRRKRNIRRSLGDGDTYSLPIWAWRLGDAVLVGSCCEPYTMLQQQLRSRYPNRVVMCLNLINGSIGYLPPKDKYEKDLYQVWQTPFDRGSLEWLNRRNGSSN